MHSVSYWRANWPSVHYKPHKHQQLLTKLVQVQYEPSSVALQTRFSPASFANAISTQKSNKFSVVSSSRRMSFSTDASSKASKSLLTLSGVPLRLHQCQLWKTAFGRSNESGFVASGAGPIWKWGGARPVQSAGKMFSWWSVQFGQFVICSPRCPPCPYAVGATVCGYALVGSDKSLTLAALTRLFGSGLPHASVLCFNPLLPPPNFLKTHRICINLKTGPGDGWGAVAPFCRPFPPMTTLMDSNPRPLDQRSACATRQPRGLRNIKYWQVRKIIVLHLYRCR